MSDWTAAASAAHVAIGCELDLPPVIFTQQEAQALSASVRLAQSRLDVALARHAEGALSKILAVLSPAARAAAENLATCAPPFDPDAVTRQRLEALRIAAEAKHTLRLAYLDLNEQRSERVVRPLGCFYWGSVWTLAAWCEAREGFRNFRVDRITELEVLEARFLDEPGKMLADLFREVEAERAERDSSTDA